MNELVSVIMPSYNTARYIGQSIQSVIDQTYQNWELIIVDDCSTDNTDDVVSLYNDDRIKYLKNKNNYGAAISRNKALREAKGRWIAFLDSDDLWMPEKLEKQIRYMKINNYSFSYTCYSEIDEQGHDLGKMVLGPREITRRMMCAYCWPGCLTVMYDSQVIGLIQIENIKKNNDYAMWLQISKIAECYLLKDVCAKYRKGRSNSISNHNVIALIKWHYRLFRLSENYGRFMSTIMTMINIIFGFIKKIYFVKEIDKI